MAIEKKTGLSGHDNEINKRNALILKIAVFLNYLSKEHHQKLLFDLQQHKDTPGIDILKLMRVKNYITQTNMLSLQKTCFGFAKSQKDARFGALCVIFEFLTQSNLNLALEEQKRLAEQDRNIMLGDLLVDAGMISEKQRNLVLQKQKLENITRKNTPADEISKDAGDHEAAEELQGFDKRGMREIREAAITLLIQNDALKAFIIKTENFDGSIYLADLRFLLEKNGIIYGVADDQSLEAFIKYEKYRTHYLKIAEGLEPIDGTDARAVFMFDRDYLKPGQLAEDGTVDFKDRGEIPFVSDGDVLVEKIPPKDGKDGVNVYGDVIPNVKANDLSFVLGKGVRLSKDGLKVISEVNGSPKVNPNGEISVNDAYIIEGDVGYATGHVKFDKNVFIKGSIKSGFRVEAIDVVVNSVDGGIIKAQGDVFIQNGATASVIEARGTIKAGFLLRSKANCMGNMTIVKEIIHSEIILEGALEMKRGRMFASNITAKGGAKIFNIGSDKASPSIITVGVSAYLENELKNLDSMIERRQNLLETKTLEKNRMEADTKIHALNDEKALLEIRIKKTRNEIIACAEAVKISVKDKLALKRIQQANPPKPILEVDGKVLAGTRIYGRHSSLLLKETVSRSRIMEINRQNDDGAKKDWEIIVTTL